MADGIRKPWLVNYLIHYAEQNGCQLSSSQPKLGKVQIINFRTLPESPEEWVWADVSDKRHTVPVRFTMEAVKAFNNDSRNAGRRLTSRRWGIASIRCIRPLWCKPPAENGKGLEERWTLALEVDRVEVAGSEGEAMFGAPRHVIQDEMVRRWMEGLGDLNGPGGNVLKLERLERERKAIELSTSVKQDKNITTTHWQRLDNVSKATSEKTDRVKEPDIRHRSRGWRDSMKDKGLVWNFGVNKKIPDVQLQRCSEITVFGMDLPTNNVFLGISKFGELESHRDEVIGSPHIRKREDILESTSLPLRLTPQKSVPEGPTTPSQWTSSQRTQQDKHESDDALLVGKSESFLNREIDPQPKEEDSEHHMEELQVQESILLQGPSGVTEKETVDGEAEATRRASKDEIYVGEAREEDPCSASTLCTPITMRQLPQDLVSIPPSVKGRPIILAPDSDISGSQSHTQSQSVTQASESSHPSHSQRSLRKIHSHKVITKPSQYDLVPDSSDPGDRPESREPPAVESVQYHGGQDDVENSELESDDEAAQKILGSRRLAVPLGNMPRSRLLDMASQEWPSSGLDARGVSPTSYQVEKSPQVSPMTFHDPDTTRVRGTKRHLDDVTAPAKLRSTSEPGSKRRRGNAQEEVVVQHVDHDADAWRGPSFAGWKENNKKRNEESPQKIRRHDLNKQTSVAKVPYDPNFVLHDFGIASGMCSTGKKAKNRRMERDKSVRQQIHRTQATGPDGATAVNVRHAPGKSHVANRLIGSSKTGDLEDKGSPGEPEMSKLGGWRPRRRVTSGPQTLNWEKFNSMLLKIMDPQVERQVETTPTFETPTSPIKQSITRQGARYEKEGKRWLRRRDNSRFTANPHVVKPTAKDFGIYPTAPRTTFPKPLPPFLPRHVSAPSAVTPPHDPVSSNAGRYTLSLKGVRRDLRRSGPRSEQIVLDMEKELTLWLHSGGIVISPEEAESPIVMPGKPLGTSDSILEISRSPMELVWRIEEDYPRFLLHCVARFHGVVSFSKPTSENDIRLTHLLRPNVTRPDFAAVGVLDTPPASDLEALSVVLDSTEESDATSDILGSDTGDIQEGSSFPVLHESLRRDTHEHDLAAVGPESSMGESDDRISWSMDSLNLATRTRAWEQTSRIMGSPTASSPSRSPSRPFRQRPRRGARIQLGEDQKQLGFWFYIFS